MPERVKILVIDDSEDDRDLYRRALASYEDVVYEVCEAADGNTGISLIEQNNPDCVLLDYSLPGRNGIEVLKIIRARNSFVPIVMLTGQGNESIAVLAMQEHAQNYIVKSAVTRDQIHHVVQLAIAHCSMAKRLQQQRHSLELFTRALAHDLKEPVRTIQSFLNLIQAQDVFTERTQRFFDHVTNAAGRMAALIDAVHFYTGLDRPTEQIVKEACSLERVFEEATSDIGELIRDRAATIASGELPNLYANPLQMRQLLQNLLCNAIHHSPKRPTIHVSAVEEPDAWVVRVADNGNGVEEEMRTKIFEPFTRLTRDARGLGLGLAICKRIAESHGGVIWCEGRPDGGSIFAFRVPKDAARPAPIEHARPEADSNKGDSLANILIVDDNEVDVELAKILLMEEERLRCNLLTAHCAEEAVALLRANSAVDLVLLDINMPGTDGFGLLRRIRSDPTLKDLPVVMCTTSSYDKDMEQAHDLGAVGYMAKPARLQNLRPELAKIPGLLLSETNGDVRLVRAKNH
jgi:signal transduction histidine kinase